MSSPEHARPTSPTSPQPIVSPSASLQILPSTSFVRPRDRRRLDELSSVSSSQQLDHQDHDVVSHLHEQPSADHQQPPPASPGTHHKNFSFDESYPTTPVEGHNGDESHFSVSRPAHDEDYLQHQGQGDEGLTPRAVEGFDFGNFDLHTSTPYPEPEPEHHEEDHHHQPPSTNHDSHQYHEEQSHHQASSSFEHADDFIPPPLPPLPQEYASSAAHPRPSFEEHDGDDSTPAYDYGDEGDDYLDDLYSGEPEMPSAQPPDLKVEVQSAPTNPPNLPKRSASLKKGAAPKQLGRALSVKNLWGWGSASKDEEEMAPPASPRSPEVTPISAEPQSAVRQAPPPSPGYYGDDNYYASDDGYTSRSESPAPFSGPPTGSADHGILVKELTDITQELAASIRREMDLEDEIDRIRTEMPTGPADHQRRTSDYYSDSGASSARFPPPDVDLKLEGLEKMRRKAEQEKAQLRIEMAQKVQEDLNQRRALEMHVQSLEEQLSAHGSSNGNELQGQLDDTKRRLNDEKQLKQNFEDLLAGMREEIESFKNERDNLRDEIVPKISSENQNLIYETTRMQQELQNLKNENQTLQKARSLQMHSSIKSIAEDAPGSPDGNLSRSNSSRVGRGRAGSLMGNQPKEDIPPEALPERLKNSEEQRDAMQRTLKSLILRQAQMTRSHTKQLKMLSSERDRALAGNPRRAGFAVEFQSLRTELNKIRLRADDALEQKFQSEKGLAGLSMDLERSKQETISLKEHIQELDKLEQSFGSKGSSPQVQSQMASNRELRERFTEAIARGEKSQAASAKKINELQSSLRAAEERLMSAQSVSEQIIAGQEDTARDINAASAEHDLRGMKTPAKGLSQAGASSNASGVFQRTRLEKTRSGKGLSAAEATQVRKLQVRVRELEEAAFLADEEMQSVIERMNAAQIQNAELDQQRDEAERQTRQLSA